VKESEVGRRKKSHRKEKRNAKEEGGNKK